MSTPRAAWMVPLSITTGEHGLIDTVRYEGVHRCRHEDHEELWRVEEEMTGRVFGGRRRILFDVRKLRVVYVSGFHDFVESWKRITTSAARAAILWNPKVSYAGLPEVSGILGAKWFEEPTTQFSGWPPPPSVIPFGVFQRVEAAHHYLSDEPDPPRA